MIMSQPALIAATVGLTPILLYIMYSDVKDGRIPNIACLMVVVVFLATGSWGLPLETFLWRIGHLVIAFFIGWGIFTIAGNVVGGGDIKILIALVPFVPGPYIGTAMVIWSGCALISVVLFLILRQVMKRRDTPFISLNQADAKGVKRLGKLWLPVGFSISMAMFIYLGLVLAHGG
ncbi:MAG: prepilin peptidase [Pseudomonadota bacterium]